MPVTPVSAKLDPSFSSRPVVGVVPRASSDPNAGSGGRVSAGAFDAFGAGIVIAGFFAAGGRSGWGRFSPGGVTC